MNWCLERRTERGDLDVGAEALTGWWPAWGTEASTGSNESGCGTGAEKGGRWMPRRLAAEEGRSHAAKRSGEGLAPGDPEVSEWGNPAVVMDRHHPLAGGGNWGN